MTREEQIVQYANSFKGKGIESDELKEVVRLAIIDGAKWADAHPRQPSLPSNLDEAAESFAWDKEQPLADGERLSYSFNPRIEAFKAGAEWLVGQGVTKEAVIGMATEKIIISVSEQTLNELDLCPGDKIVVQIRKK